MPDARAIRAHAVWTGQPLYAGAIAHELTTRQISLSLGGSVYGPTDAVGRLLFNVLSMVPELFGVGRSTEYRAIEWQRLEARAGLAEATSKR